MAKKKARRGITRTRTRKERKKVHRIYIHEEGMIGYIEFVQEMIGMIDEDHYGVYLLTTEAAGKIVVAYVGRGNIRERLTKHLRDRKKRKVLHFYFKLLSDAEEAFWEECRLYHLYGKKRDLLNEKHPEVPAGFPRNYPKCWELGCNGED